MSIRLGVFAAIFAALALPANAVPFTVEVEQNGGDGSASISYPAAGTAIVELAGSNEAPTFTDPGYGQRIETVIWLTYTGLTPFTLVADWVYLSLDQFTNGELFGYYPERDYDSFVDLTDGSSTTDSGQFPFEMASGSSLGFYILSWDNCCGRASATVTLSNVPYVPDPSPIPLPATALLMLPALGALGLMRRKPKVKA